MVFFVTPGPMVVVHCLAPAVDINRAGRGCQNAYAELRHLIDPARDQLRCALNLLPIVTGRSLLTREDWNNVVAPLNKPVPKLI